MTKILKSKYKKSRSLGISIWGDNKDSFHTKNYQPGQHGTNTKGKKSDYGLHLNAKQVVKFHYGRITEKQFKNLFSKASKIKGNTAENFAGLLERRLDMVVYRMNIAPSIFTARQLVSHKHILLNGKIVNIASILVKEGDKIELSETARNMIICQDSIKNSPRSRPEYVDFDPNKMVGSLIRTPTISDIPYPFQPDFNKIIEFYSR